MHARLAAHFFATALVYAILGMALGLVMGLTKDHSQMPTHAHLLVVGWVSFAIFGFFYHLFPEAAGTRLAHLHFWLAQTSLITLTVGLFLLFNGVEAADPLAAIGSIGLLISMIVFAIVAWPALTSRA
jgi:cbb3-type cytochrome oxidase subunit 1